MKNFAKQIKSIVSMFANLNGASFVGIREYLSTSTGEIANHVIIANFSYTNAVKHDLTALQNVSIFDLNTINNEYGFSVELIKQAINKLKTAFENNQNTETQSNQSKGQNDAYLHITNSIKLHIETRKLYIYALSHSKTVICEGEHKQVNSRELTLCQNAVKKYFKFKTIKFRQFIVEPSQLSTVAVNGEQVCFV
jgi:hypothetical protein